MTETADVHLTLAEGVPLLHAMVARIARDHGVRALLIKGPVLAMQGLREPRQSGDVDVLCEPSGVDAFTQALVQLGWKAFNEQSGDAASVRKHALGFHHPRWPCGIDVHHRFPGFYAPDQSVFDALWSRRTVVDLAAQPVDCTDLLGSAMIHGLHLLRGRNLTLTESDLTHLVETLRRASTMTRSASSPSSRPQPARPTPSPRCSIGWAAYRPSDATTCPQPSGRTGTSDSPRTRPRG